MTENYVLELKNITKIFPGVKALDNVNFRLKKGEIHALVGENGAGKSTLIKILTGVYQPDEGAIFIDGKKVSLINPQEAFSHGINVVYQERNLVPTFTVAENIMMEQYCSKIMSKINQKKINQNAQKYIDLVGLDFGPTKNVEELTIGKQQLVEIAKSLSSEAKIIFLDEPTASISVKEGQDLLKLIKNLKNQGYTFVFVSHKLEEVFNIADTVTVLRDGKNVKGINTDDIQVPIKDLTREQLITMMIGRKEEFRPFESRNFSDKKIVLQTKNVRSTDSPKPKSFSLYEGELLGWYGLVGAGRTEFARTLFGYDPPIDGEVFIKGHKINIKNIIQMQNKHKLYYLSENRKEEGLFLTHSIKINITSSMLNKIANNLGMLDFKREREVAIRFKERLDIKSSSINQLVINLSGGNQQKVSIAKGLSVEPDILLIDEPTVGIDVKTKAEIHRLMYNLTSEGKSIVCITSDLQEIVQIADRIVVFKEGCIVDELKNTKVYSEMSKRIMESIID